jgi:hypothetical protein
VLSLSIVSGANADADAFFLSLVPTPTAEDHPVFGKPLRESLKYASVQISTADANGNLYVWGYIPVVVAKWSVLSLCPG